MKRWILLLLLLFLPMTALSEGTLTLETGDIKGFAENTLRVNAPEAGSLVVRVSDQFNVYRTLRADVQAGENTILWDGLGENEERIYDEIYTLTGELTLADGRVITSEQKVKFISCAQAVTFALPCDDTVYQGEKGWFVELAMVRAGSYKVEIYRADVLAAPVETRRGQCENRHPVKFYWNAKGYEPGDYVLRFYAEGNPAYSYDIPVTVKSGKAPLLPLTVTETFMPQRGDSDETIWKIMMQPSAVVNITEQSHQSVYVGPNKKSGSLGTLHGSSQAVEIVELLDGWAHVRAWNHEQGAHMDGYVPTSVLKMVEPNGDYGLLLDKQDQTITVYHKGKKISTMPVSTGVMTKGQLYRETAAGCFFTLYHEESFPLEGYHFDYPIRFDGGNLLHLLGYKEVGGRNDFSDHAALLGSKASHGCVRLPFVPTEEGVNAYWLWTRLPYHTRVIILDDEENRTREALALEPGRGK